VRQQALFDEPDGIVLGVEGDRAEVFGVAAQGDVHGLAAIF